MIVRYEGWPGTGLRLEDPDDMWRCLDTGGSHGRTGGMELFIKEGTNQNSAKLELQPEDVARLASHCAQWLAWHISGRPNKRQ